MKRVLIVEPSGHLFGSERALLDLLPGMQTLYIAVCCPPDTMLHARLEERNIRTLPYLIGNLHKKSRWHRILSALGMLRACLEFRPDVIYLNQAGCYRVVLPAATILNIPIIAHIRIFEDVPYLARQNPNSYRVCGIIAGSAAVEQEIRRFPELKIIPVQHAYDAFVSSLQKLSSALPERLVNRIACVGRVVPTKGLDVLVGALDVLNRGDRDVECLVVGHGEERFVGELKQLASTKCLTNNIHWLGFVAQVIPLLQTCSVLAFPSYRETVGRVIFEAWEASVVPVVYAGSGGAAEIVASANGGIVYDDQTPESLAKALQQALELDQEHRARLIENGQAWMAANCKPEVCGAAVAAMLSGTRRTRALILEASGNMWGSERSLLDLLKGNRTLEVAVCYPPRKSVNRELKKLRIRRMPYYVYDLHHKSRWHRLWAAIGVLWACLQFRAEIIHLNQSGSYRVALLAAKILNLPIIAHVRIFEDANYLAQQRPLRSRLRGIIAISAAVESEIRQLPDLDGIPVHQIYNAYSPWSQTLLPIQDHAAVKRIACVGRLVPIKGHDVLVGALSKLKSIDSRIECLIVGDGDERYTNEIKQMALRKSVSSLLQWTGFVNDVVPLLRTCSVLVCPSYREPLGRVIFEAWDAGVIPVVYSGSGGAVEMVTAANGGVVYQEQTAESLAHALQRALAFTVEERAKLVANGRSWMAKNCNPETYAMAVSSIFSNASSRRSST